jgi:cysteinyl-tRNA synthetase
MDNDFNTAQGLGLIFETVKDLNRVRQQLPAKPGNAEVAFLRESARQVTKLCLLMGLLTEPPSEYLKSRHQGELADLEISAEEINDLIAQRQQARQEKNWAGADEIRDLLLSKGIELKDSANGTTWKAIKE